MPSTTDLFEEPFVSWARSIGKSEKTVKNYVGALKRSIPSWLCNAGIKCDSLLAITSYSELQNLHRNSTGLAEFILRDKKGNGMYSAAWKALLSFIADANQIQLQRDVEALLIDSSIPDTERATLVNTRLGQGKFREALIRYWQGCALTRYRKYPFLVASHIKPWSQASHAERLDPFNGLLLLANIDKAFDHGYISFSEAGKIIVSEQLEDYQAIGLNKDMSIRLDRQHQDYLAFHRESCFRG